MRNAEGLHKETVVATVAGIGIKAETRTFSTFTNSLKELGKWLKSVGVRPVAMESTGVYWKPVFNVLEADFEIMLVNARHIKNVPGHKTDKKDSVWITRVIVKRIAQREFYSAERDSLFERFMRATSGALTGQVSAEKNRLQKILEDANIKLSSVVSDTFGVSATRIIDALIAGEEDIKELIKLCARAH